MSLPSPVFKNTTSPLMSFCKMAESFAGIIAEFSESALANGSIETGIINFLTSTLTAHQATLVPPAPVIPVQTNPVTPTPEVINA